MTESVFLFHLEDIARFADAEALGVEVGGPQFIPRSDEATDVRARRLFGKAG